jgi:hypothetical protein
MTQTEEDSWRGVAAEDSEDIGHAAGLRLQRRGRALLASMLRPQRVAVAAAFAAVVVEKLSGLLALRPSAPDTDVPTALPSATGDVRFDHVKFSYRKDSAVVLPELDLHIPAGQTVAVVGATGAGKSTIAKLIARFYDPVAGRVLLDGVPLSQVDTPDLRRAVTMVTQENFLFSGSVADNISLGDLTASRAQVEAAASGPKISSGCCRRATTRMCASAADGCRRGNASWWRSPGLSWPTQRCWCSTRQRPVWTFPPSERSRRRCNPSSRTARP